jgi:hypothetical protein
MMHRRLNPEQSYLVSGNNSFLQIDSLIHVGFKAGNPTAHANKNLGVRTCSKFTHNIRVHSWYEEYITIQFLVWKKSTENKLHPIWPKYAVIINLKRCN